VTFHAATFIDAGRKKKELLHGKGKKLVAGKQQRAAARYCSLCHGYGYDYEVRM
jgi:hypothetical protein